MFCVKVQLLVSYDEHGRNSFLDSVISRSHFLYTQIVKVNKSGIRMVPWHAYGNKCNAEAMRSFHNMLFPLTCGPLGMQEKRVQAAVERRIV